MAAPPIDICGAKPLFLLRVTVRTHSTVGTATDDVLSVAGMGSIAPFSVEDLLHHDAQLALVERGRPCPISVHAALRSADMN